MSDERAERIAFMVEHHARVNASEPGWTDRAVRRLIREAGEHLDGMVRFSGADYTTRRRARAARIRAHLADLKRRLAMIQEADQAPRVLPARLGVALCDGLDVAPGPHIGEAIAWLEAEIAAGRLEAGQGIEVYVEAVRAR
jgi:poly(A) polymerase